MQYDTYTAVSKPLRSPFITARTLLMWFVNHNLLVFGPLHRWRDSIIALKQLYECHLSLLHLKCWILPIFYFTRGFKVFHLEHSLTFIKYTLMQNNFLCHCGNYCFLFPVAEKVLFLDKFSKLSFNRFSCFEVCRI